METLTLNNSGDFDDLNIFNLNNELLRPHPPSTVFKVDIDKNIEKYVFLKYEYAAANIGYKSCRENSVADLNYILPSKAKNSMDKPLKKSMLFIACLMMQ